MTLRLRMEVVDIMVTCPHGKGEQRLSDCYLNSVTPSHACASVDGGRCPAALDFAAQYGWRSYRVLPIPYCTHELYPVFICYLPLDAAGTEWYALNSFTGERWRVLLHAAWPMRRTPEGVDVTNVYSWGPMVWNAPPLDQWRCHCEKCRTGGWSMPRGVVDPFDTRPKIDPSSVPSAGAEEMSTVTPPPGSGPSRYFPGTTGKYVRNPKRPLRREAPVSEPRATVPPKPAAKPEATNVVQTPGEVLTKAFEQLKRKGK